MNRKKRFGARVIGRLQVQRLEPRLMLAGGPDPTFGTGGTSLIKVNGSAGIVIATRELSDGKTLVLAAQPKSSTSSAQLASDENQATTVFKFNAAGAFDTSFTPIQVLGAGPAGKQVDGRGLTVLADGSFIVTGTIHSTGANKRDLFWAKYSSAGTAVAGFGSNGSLQFDPVGSGDDRVYAVSYDATRSRVVVYANQGGATSNALVAFRTDTGQLDTSWGASSNGYSPIPATIGSFGLFTPSTSAGGMKLDPSGRVLMAGTYGSGASAQMGLARFSPVGISDSLYGSGGGASANVLQSTGQAVALSANGRNAFVTGTVTSGTSAQLITARFSNPTSGIPNSTPAGTFASTVVYPAGTQAYTTVLADLNNDGVPDAISSNPSTNRLSILMGSGQGTFGAPTFLTTPSNPRGVLAADFNGDGVQDLAVACAGTGQVAVFIATDLGVFAAPLVYTVGSAPDRLIAADFNGDGRPDIAVVNTSSNTASVLISAVGGTFNRTDFGAGSNATSPAVADLNGDGRPDVLTVNSFTNTVSVLLGNGNGTLASKVDYVTGFNPTSVTVADFNGDGKKDLAVTDQTGVSVLLGSGTGTFGAKATYATELNARSVATGDFNGDGKVDLAVANTSSDSISILLGNGNGTFAASVNYATGGASPNCVVTGDFNGDGKVDLAVSKGGGNQVSVLLGIGDGTFLPKVDYSTGGSPVGVTTGDFNADGKPDLATANSFTNTVSVLLGNGNGTFASRVDYAVGAFPTSVTAGDFNGDGDVDVAVGSSSDNTISVLAGSGSGTFATKVDFATGQSPSIASGDMNGDGRTDLVTANSGSSNVSVLISSIFVTPGVYAVGLSPKGLVAGDFDGDGQRDLVTVNSGGNNVSFLKGDGFGGFTSAINSAAGTFPGAIATGDFNGDGKPDLIVTNPGTNAVLVLTGNNTGTFVAGSPITVLGGPAAVAVADFNGDGRLDVVTANQNNSTASVLLGNGAGGFGSPTGNSVGGLPNDVVVGDVDGDRRPDFVVPSLSNGTVFVAINNGFGVNGTVTLPAFAASGVTPVVRDTVISDDLRRLFVVANLTQLGAQVGVAVGSIDAVGAVLASDFGTAGVQTLHPNINSQVPFASSLELLTSGSLLIAAGLSRPGTTRQTDGAAYLFAPTGTSESELNAGDIVPRDVRLDAVSRGTGGEGYFASGVVDTGREALMVLASIPENGIAPVVRTFDYLIEGAEVSSTKVVLSGPRVLVFSNLYDPVNAVYQVAGVAFSPITLAIDATYGNDGFVFVLGAISQYFNFRGATLTPGGSLLLAGATVSQFAGTQYPSFYQYTAAGQPDGAFGSGGQLNLSAFPQFGAQAITTVPAVLGGGLAVPLEDEVGALDPRLLYLNADGSIDTTRGATVAGYTSFQFAPGLNSSDTTVSAVSVWSGGVVVLGNVDLVGSKIAVVEFLASGFVNTAFGSGGSFQYPTSNTMGLDIRVSPNDTLVIAGSLAGNAVTFRLTAAGSLDLSYGPGGAAVGLGGPGAYYALAGLSGENPLAVGVSYADRDTGLLTRVLADLPDLAPPTFSTSPSFTFGGSTTLVSVTVTYTDPSGVAASSISTSNIGISGNTGNYLPISFALGAQTATTLVVTYTFQLNPNNVRNLTTLNGSFFLKVRALSVADTLGNTYSIAQQAATVTLAFVNADTTPPTVTYGGPAGVVQRTSVLTFSVTYTDATGVDLASLKVTNLAVSGPKGFLFDPDFQSVNPVAGGFKVTYTIDLNKTGETDLTKLNGTYTISILGAPISDLVGNVVPSTQLAALQVTFDLTAPVVTYASPLTADVGRVTRVRFTLRITDDQALGSSPINVSGVSVTSPLGGVRTPTLVSVTSVSATVADAVFEIDVNPSNLSKLEGLSGNYVVSISNAAVTDGAGNFAPAGLIGTTNLRFAAALSVSVPSVAFTTFTGGGNLFVGLSVTNSGNIPSDTGTLSLFLVSSDGTRIVLVQQSLPPVAAGATSDVTNPIGFATPAGLVPGEYSLRVEVLASGSTISAVTPAAVLRIVAPPARQVGGLDPTFGNGTGKASTFVPADITNITAPAVVGQNTVVAGNNSNGMITVFRLTSAGTLDPSLAGSTGGVVNIDFRGTPNVATVVIGDRQGRTLIVGYSLDAATGVAADIVVARLNPDGSYDTTFGVGGKVILLLPTLPATASNVIRAATTDTSGRIYLAGSSVVDNGLASPLLLRLSVDGTLDRAFGVGGVAKSPALPVTKPALSKDIRYGAVLLTTDNRLMVGGSVGNRVLVARFTTAGVIDTKFGQKGVFVGAARSTADRATAVVQASRGSYYVGGTAATLKNGVVIGSRAILFRLSSVGVLDTAFAKGILTVPVRAVPQPFTTVSSLILQADQRILISIATANSLAAASTGRTGTTIIRYSDNGSVDGFFNKGVPVVTDPAPIVTAASNPVVDGFEAFAATRKGAAVALSGGGVRSLALSGAAGGVRVDSGQLTADAADLAVALTVRVRGSVKPGFKGTFSLNVSNRGSISASGKVPASLSFISSTSPSTTFALSPQTLRLSGLAAGRSTVVTVSFVVPGKVTSGKYQLSATLTPSFREVTSANNTALGRTKADLITVAATTKSAVSTLPAQGGTSSDLNRRLRWLFSSRQLLDV